MQPVSSLGDVVHLYAGALGGNGDESLAIAIESNERATRDDDMKLALRVLSLDLAP